jgi:diacylglycerol kinase
VAVWEILMRPTPPFRSREPHYLPVERSRFFRSFHHAFEGIIYATRTQRNMRVHFLIAALVLLATLLLRLDRVYVIATVALIALVLSLELMNTAIESIVDLLTVAHHPLAKTAKERPQARSWWRPSARRWPPTSFSTRG